MIRSRQNKKNYPNRPINKKNGIQISVFELKNISELFKNACGPIFDKSITEKLITYTVNNE